MKIENEKYITITICKKGHSHRGEGKKQEAMINFLKPKLKMQPAVKLSVYGSIDSITI
jgi:hypothetical protein